MFSGRKIKLIAVSLLTFLNFSYAVPGACDASPESTVEILVTSLKTLYNTFPIRIGGIEILKWKGVEDRNTAGAFPICICMTPFPRIGIKLSFWEPHALVETVKIPWCSPSVGMYLPVPFNEMNVGGETAVVGGGNDTISSYQVHYYRYLPWTLIELFLDIICMETDNPFDLAYPTELDPLWQDDRLALVINPEAILFSNPIAQLACTADAAAVNLGFPLDPLFWCAGSWGQVYPFTKNVQKTDPPQASGLAVSKALFKLHREGVLWGTFTEAGLCGKFPMPIWKKSMYGIYPIYPVPWHLRFPPGRHAFAGWGFGKDIPVKNRHNWVWMLYRKRDCCAF